MSPAPDFAVESPPFGVSVTLKAVHVSADEAPSAPVSDAPAFGESMMANQALDPQALDDQVLSSQALDEPSLDVASRTAPNFDTIEQRYPLLRNAL